MNSIKPVYQYIVICATEERKNKTNELLNIVNKSNASIHNLQATTPSNNNDFLTSSNNDFNIKETKILCCLKSHFRALEYAIKDDSLEYSIILEDDVTFLTENYCELVEEIIQNIENNKKYDKIEMVQIGWIPGNNYSQYKILYKSFDNINLHDNELSVFNSFFAFGAQGYIVKKSKISKFKDIIISKNYNECFSLLSKYSWFDTSSKALACDYIINRIFDFVVIFPPLIIERVEESLLEHSNKHYWDKYFDGFESEKEKYIL